MAGPSKLSDEEREECCPRCGGSGRVSSASITFGDRIRKLRELAGLNQTELAKAVGLSRASIANIETNRAKTELSKIRAFSQALRCGLEELIP